jgi:hypothetical protein
MTASNTRRAFQLFHAILGLGLLTMSLFALSHALHDLGGHGHYAFVAGLEALGAVLLLIPRTVRWGGAVLLVVLLPGFAYHLAQGDWEIQLLIFAAGVWFVMVHGPAWARRSRPPAGAAGRAGQ